MEPGLHSTAGRQIDALPVVRQPMRPPRDASDSAESSRWSLGGAVPPAGKLKTPAEVVNLLPQPLTLGRDADDFVVLFVIMSSI